LAWVKHRLRVCAQEAHIAKLRSNLEASGDASLQNAMNLAVDSLKSIPPYGHREVDGSSLLG
jgi:hypothetical protein